MLWLYLVAVRSDFCVDLAELMVNIQMIAVLEWHLNLGDLLQEG